MECITYFSIILTYFDFIVLAVADGRPPRLAPQLLLEPLEGQVRPADALLVPRQ